MKRKDFIKLMGLGVSGVAFGSTVMGRELSRSFFENGGHYPIIMIGTGYGNAVAARRLGEAGKTVLMLEMGLDWDAYNAANNKKFYQMASPEKETTWLRKGTVAPFANMTSFDMFTGILHRYEFDHVKVYQGRGIGGGSLVNGGMAVVPKRSYFEEMMPQLDADAFYDTYFPRANTGLMVNEITDKMYNSEWYNYARVGVEEGANAGFTKSVNVPNVYDYDYMGQELDGTVPTSALNGEVIYGNNYGKNDLTKTYIKKALDTGNVSIMTLHEADSIEMTNDGKYKLIVKELNYKGLDKCLKEFTCDKLFIGAGSIGSTELLLKSAANGGLADLDSNVGKYWGNNGNVMAARDGGLSARGANQSTIPARGLDYFDDPTNPFFAEIAPFPAGLLGQVFIGDLGTYLVVNKLKEFGNMSWDKMTNSLKVNWNETHTAHMREITKFFLDKMNDANGGEYATGSSLIPIFPDNGIDETICYHPLGGCVIGKATDLRGRVNNYKNLYVTDGALIPGSVGVNPFVTITAISEFCIEDIIANDF